MIPHQQQNDTIVFLLLFLRLLFVLLSLSLSLSLFFKLIFSWLQEWMGFNSNYGGGVGFVWQWMTVFVCYLFISDSISTKGWLVIVFWLLTSFSFISLLCSKFFHIWADSQTISCSRCKLYLGISPSLLHHQYLKI